MPLLFWKPWRMLWYWIPAVGWQFVIPVNIFHRTSTKPIPRKSPFPLVSVRWSSRWTPLQGDPHIRRPGSDQWLYLRGWIRGTLLSLPLTDITGGVPLLSQIFPQPCSCKCGIPPIPNLPPWSQNRPPEKISNLLGWSILGGDPPVEGHPLRGHPLYFLSHWGGVLSSMLRYHPRIRIQAYFTR